MLHIVRQYERYMLSLLYFFGVLTITGQTALGELMLNAPNLVVLGMYFQQLKQHALPNPQDDVAAAQLAVQFYQSGDLQALAGFMEDKYFAVFNNRDYRWSNELTLKTAFLSLLFNDRYYIMDSETALARRYSDLAMIIRPGMRKYPALHDFVFEFKYLKLAELGITGEQVRNTQRETLLQLAPVQTALSRTTG